MDILAHGLWAWAGGEVLRRRGRLTRKTLGVGVALSLAPDLLQYAPILAGMISGDVSGDQLVAYAMANPGQEPPLPGAIALIADHLHCFMHSIVIAASASLAAWWWRRAWLYPMLGWWLHIVTDIPTHSAEYYAVPIFYPFSTRGFDGVAWTTPAFMVGNYLLLTAVGVWLLRTRA